MSDVSTKSASLRVITGVVLSTNVKKTIDDHESGVLNNSEKSEGGHESGVFNNTCEGGGAKKSVAAKRRELEEQVPT